MSNYVNCYNILMVTVGIDEVGRGCWAGPLVVGAVILNSPVEGLKDSKKLTRNQRESLAEHIKRSAICSSLGWVWPPEIDGLGLTKATTLAIRRALEQIEHEYDEVIIDGKFNFLADNPKCRAIIKADDAVSAVSAASVMAKVARDGYMRSLVEQFPDYGFDSHVGYGTKKHLKSITDYGLLDIHRKSFKPLAALV